MLKYILLLMLVSSPLFANCKKADLAGRYTSYSLNEFGSLDCIFKILKNGSVKAGTPCSGRVTVTGGKLNINRKCRVSGHVSTNQGRTRIPAASLTRNGQVLSGISSTNVDGLFVAVKE